MAKIDKLKYKNQLEQYLKYHSTPSRKEGSKIFYKCPNPAHADEKPSTVIYDNPDGQQLYCASACGCSWDIFDVCELMTGKKDFKEQVAEIDKCLNINATTTKDKPKKKPEKKKQKYVSLPIDKAREIYISEKMLNLAKRMKWGDKIAGNWPFYNADKTEILMIDVRFEFGGNPNDKNVISFYYNGEKLTTKNSPVLIYGQDLLTEDKPRLIVEGCKTAEAAQQALPNFTVHTWNRGTSNIDKADWSIFENETLYFWPDDDQKKDRNNKIKPPHEQPGIKAALELKKILPHLKIIEPLEAARKIKPDGADLVDVLRVVTDPVDIESYITDSPEYYPVQDDQTSLQNEQDPFLNYPQPPDRSVHSGESSFPFKPLGVGDDNYKYFIDQAERIQRMKKVTKSELFDLADLTFWEREFGNKGKVSWDEAINFTVQSCIHLDFDLDKIRGRGAWRDKDGNYLFHDGNETHGEHNNGYIYLRKSSIYEKMGLFDKQADMSLCQKMAATINKMTFETKLDTVRCLSWATLAPFAGCLPWRPAALVTGPSASGKSTIIDYVVKNLSGHYLYANGADTTPAGLRGKNAADSTAIILEEVEGDTEKKMVHREDLFSMMRQSTSDGAPMSLKGTKDGGYISYNMTNMFMFIGIDPTIQHEADSKRIFTINIVRPQTPWKGMKKEIESVMTEENCRAVRALTWKRLPEILETAEEISEEMIQTITGKDNRSSFAESLMIATYLLIWRGMKSVTEWNGEDWDDAGKRVFEIFKDNNEEHNDNEVHDMLDKFLDTSVSIVETKETKTLRMMIYDLKNHNAGSHETEYKQTLERYGLKIIEFDKLAVEKKNNSEIIKIIGRGKDYAKFLLRHDHLEHKYKSVWMAGKTRQCLVFKDLLNEKPEVDEQKEIDFEELAGLKTELQ